MVMRIVAGIGDLGNFAGREAPLPGQLPAQLPDCQRTSFRPNSPWSGQRRRPGPQPTCRLQEGLAMGILSWIVLGLIAGLIAKFIMPGNDPGGIIVTILIGIVGAVVGGFIATALGFGGVSGIANMAEWQKSKIFDYGGRTNQAAPKFYTQDCVMFTESSAGYGGMTTNVTDFEFGVGMLPYYDDVAGAPQNSIIGGASLWVLTGKSDEEYAGVAKFFSYLSSPEVQADWHQATGYLPITTAAYELSQEQGFYKENPGTDTAIRQITLNPPTENSKGLRFGNFVQIRDIVNEELEAVWNGSKSAQEALDAATARGDELLRQFEDANS
jgi:uncharacterized membrane protein YeaQ/YmgE (transglycosylase-associated protein family)